MLITLCRTRPHVASHPDVLPMTCQDHNVARFLSLVVVADHGLCDDAVHNGPGLGHRRGPLGAEAGGERREQRLSRR